MKKVYTVVTMLLATALLVSAGAAYADGIFSCNAQNPAQTAYAGGSDALYKATVSNLDTCDLYIVNAGCGFGSQYDTNAISVSFPSYPFIRIAPGETWSGTILQIHANYVPGGGTYQMEFGWGFSIQKVPGGPFPSTLYTRDTLTIANAPSVPEPSSILAIICGIGGMGRMVWRRKSV